MMLFEDELVVERAHGHLRAGQPIVDVVDLGDAERLLRDKAHFRAAVRAEKKNDEPQREQAWSRWLGKHLAETEQARTEARQRRSRSDRGR